MFSDKETFYTYICSALIISLRIVPTVLYCVVYVLCLYYAFTSTHFSSDETFVKKHFLYERRDSYQPSHTMFRVAAAFDRKIPPTKNV